MQISAVLNSAHIISKKILNAVHGRCSARVSVCLIIQGACVETGRKMVSPVYGN